MIGIALCGLGGVCLATGVSWRNPWVLTLGCVLTVAGFALPAGI